MPVIALYNFNDAGTVAADDATGNGAQDGSYTDGAASVGGRAVLDGINDKAKMTAEDFQMSKGTLEIQFSVDALKDDTQTVLSRDSTGQTAGGYRIEVQGNGAILITHETADDETTYCTDPGFIGAGDEVKVSYSWDEAQGGKLIIDNQTAGTSFVADTPDGLTMDMGDINQKWMVGAGQSASDPYLLNNLNHYMQGSVGYFQLSDTVDNITDPMRDGLVFGSSHDDLIDGSYTGDPDGDVVDHADAILAGDAPNDDRIYAFGGNDTVLAGAGDDTVFGGMGNDDVSGSIGADVMRGNLGDDTLRGGDGADVLYGDKGNDLIDSGTGELPRPDLGYPGLYPADADPTNDTDFVRGGAGDDTIRTGDDADTIFGGRDNDDIDGGVDNDSIEAGLGDDTVVGGEGADTLSGRQGDDLIYGGLGADAPDAINIPDADGDAVPNNGTDLIYGGFGNDTIFGKDDDDTIYGGADADQIDAGVDDDLVYGGRGNDTLTGGEGQDSLYGGADRDLFVVGAPGDGNNDLIDGNEGGDDCDTLDLSGSGPLRINYDSNPENGTVHFLDDAGNETGTLTFRNIENVVPCFTPGTLVATPKGEVPVESLRAGDKIITRDNGIQEIRWTGARHLDWSVLSANPHLKPIRIRQGSLGNGLPERDMMVSPNHRMLVANDRTALYFEEHEVLVAAKHLTGAKGVQAVDSMGTTYLHFLFDRHEVVLANGAWTESFQPGDLTLKGMGNAQRNEIFELFPELREEAGLADYTSARRTLKKHEASLLDLR